MSFLKTKFSLFLLAVACAGIAAESASAITCEQLADEAVQADIQEVSTDRRPVNRRNWSRFDVLVAFDRRACLKSLKQSLLSYKGELFWQFATTEDPCDGGNVYGAIYSFDLKTPIAHIYDHAITCKPDWRPDHQARRR